ncbi:MAG: HD domain-containing protein [Dehalococcoidia bacterium]|nr:HD domain-containing protein [Dehalococcoidia bacterium]
MSGEEAFPLDSRCRALLARLATFFAGRDITAYATGGFLRDALLGQRIHDIDLSIGADPLVVGPDLAAALEGHYFVLDAEKRLARVLLPAEELHIDLLPIRGEIAEDLRRRDYTIDALAAALGEAVTGRAAIIDPTGGLADLQSRTVRLTEEAALLADPLRLLRGARIATQVDFRVAPQTAELIRRHAALVTRSAPERQRDELMRILGTPRAAAGLRLLDDLGLFDHIFPEMAAARGCEQPKEHYWDVLNHSFATVQSMDLLLAEEEPPSASGGGRRLWRELWSGLAWWPEAREYFRREVVMGTARCAVLKLGCLLHDIGKPQTRTFDGTGRMRFFGHADAGAEIAVRLLQRLRFSAREVALVRAMIEAHMRPLQMAQQGPPTRRAIYRFFRDTGDAGIDTLFLSLADHLGAVGPRVKVEAFRRHVALIAYVLTQRFQAPEVVSPPRLLRGDELMRELGLAPGPLVGRLLEQVREAQAAGEVSTREEALAFARREMERLRAE